MGGFQDQDAVPESEAFAENEGVGESAEEGAHLLGNEFKSGPLEKSATWPPPGFGYNANKRPYRDGAFSIALIAFTTVTVCIGIFAALNHDANVFRGQSLLRYTCSAESCTVDAPEFLDAPKFSTSKAALRFLRVLSHSPVFYVMLATLILSPALGAGLLWVLRKHTKKVFLAVPVMFTILSATILLLPVSCLLQLDGCQLDGNPTNFVILIVVACLVLLLMWINWHSTELSIHVIRTASEVLHKNAGLLFVVPAMKMTYFLYYVSVVSSMFLAYANGKIVWRSWGTCYQNANLAVTCPLVDQSSFVWKTDRWVPAYFVLAIFVTFWTRAVFNELEMFTISGTITQWYFSSAQNPTKFNLKAVNRSLRHALGPSLGTVCLAGLARGPTNILGGAPKNSSRKRGAIARLIRRCVLSVFPCLEFMTIFTTDFAAITGEGFCSSARNSCDLLERNFLCTTVADSSPHRLLVFFVYLSSAVSGIVVWVVLNLVVQNWTIRWQTGFWAFLFVLIVLGSCTRTLIQVVDSLYICYAIDKDNGEVSNTMVHATYALLPPRPDCGFGPVADSKMAP